MKFDMYTVIVVGMICFTALIVLIIVANTFKKVKVKGSKGEIELGGDSREETTDNSNRKIDIKKTEEITNDVCFKLDCNAQKLGYIAMTIVNICYKIDYTLLRGIMEEQMNWTEQKLKIIQESDIKLYLSLLKSRLENIPEDSIVKDDSFMGYINVTYRVYGELKEFFRSCFIENHIADLKESDWDDYKRDKIEYALLKMNEVIDMTYATNSIIGREEIRNELRISLVPKIKGDFHDILDKARKISRQKQETVDELRKELDEFQMQVSGIIADKK